VPAGRSAQPTRKNPGGRACQDPRRTGRFASIFVAYADCGTGGLLDAVLAKKVWSAFPVPIATSFLLAAPFAEMAEAELGTFYLTDFLLQHFDRLIIHGLGIDMHPELLPVYFGNYETGVPGPGGSRPAKRASRTSRRTASGPGI
jgi:hypothetical protein